MISTHNFGNFWVFPLILNFHNMEDSKSKAASRSSGTQGSNDISFSKFCLSAKACCLFTKMLRPFVGRWRSQEVESIMSGAYAGGVGALGARAPPPPTWKKSSAQKSPKEERKFRPDKLAKRMCTFRSDTTKLKRKRQGKKKM